MSIYFELSTYGVEEMNKQELIEVDGGVAPVVVWVLKTIASAVIGGIVTYYAHRALLDEENEIIINSTRENREIKIINEAIKILPDGTMYVTRDSVIYY